MTLREHLGQGPFALAMSSGFFGFFAHAGFLSVLEEEGLLPTRISGSSAGGFTGAVWASGMSARAFGEELLRLERRDFWDPGPGLGLLRGHLFRARLERLLPTRDFSACRVPVALSIYDIRTRKTRVVSGGDLADAIRATCAVPFLFHPVRIDGRPSFDGGILDRPGLAGMPEAEERVLFHHLGSKSPWRHELTTPKRRGMLTFTIDGLPRSGPFKLEQGRRAFDVARRATRHALDQRITVDHVTGRDVLSVSAATPAS